MNIAYLISAYLDPNHLVRLVRALHIDAHYFIHVDKRANLDAFTAHLKDDNIHFIQDRVRVRWGTMLQVEYMMKLLQAAVDYPLKFDRIFSLSGQDYPVWSNDQITDFLSSLDHEELLQGICIDSEVVEEKQRELYQVARPIVSLGFLPEKLNLKLSVLARKLLKGMGHRKELYFVDNQGQVLSLYKGSDYWCITEDLARYVLEKYHTDKTVRKYFSDSFAPSETLIHTLAFNSPQFSQHCIRYRGEYPGLARLTPLHFIDYQPLIHILTEKDYQRILDSGKMFIRKAQTGPSDTLMDMLDRDRDDNYTDDYTTDEE